MFQYSTSMIMNNMFKAGIAFFTLLWITGCEPKAAPDNGDKPFCLTDDQYKKLEIDTIQASEVEDHLQLNGKVAYNDDNVNHVFPLVSGTVESVKVQLGDAVHKGQVLAVIKSTEFAQFSSDLTNAQNNLSVAKKNLDATQDMYNSGLSSAKDLLSAQATYSQAKAELNRVNSVLQINGGTGSGDEYSILSPIDGFVVEKFITNSTKIRPDNGNALFTISDLKNVWVIGNAYESDISKINLGDETDVTTLSYPGKVFKGKVDKIFNVLDPVNKVMQVRVQLDNPDYLLKPEMYASVLLTSANEKVSMPMVPSKSIIFDNSKNYVLVIKDKCTISVREVRLGQAANGMTYIQSGVSAGERVIASGQLYIYQALNMNSR